MRRGSARRGSRQELTVRKRVQVMARKLAVLGLAALLGTAAGASVQLNKDNFDAEVFDSGKHAFIKFQAPW